MSPGPWWGIIRISLKTTHPVRQHWVHEVLLCLLKTKYVLLRCLTAELPSWDRQGCSVDPHSVPRQAPIYFPLYFLKKSVTKKFLLMWFQTCRPQEPVHNYRICPPHSGQHTGILNTMTVAWMVRADLINTHVFMIKWAVGTDDGQTVGTRVTTYYNNQEWNKNESFHCGG